MVDFSSAESPLANAPGWKSGDISKLNPEQLAGLNQYMKDNGQGGVDPHATNFYASPTGRIGGEPTAYDVKTGGYNEAPKSKKSGKEFSDFLLPIAATVGSMLLGPEIGLGLEGLGMGAGAETLGGALAGGAIGAGGSALSGGNPLFGGLEGALGGAIGPNIGGITDSVFGSGTPTMGQFGANPSGTPGIAAGGSIPGTAAPISGAAAGVPSAPASVSPGGAGGFGGDVTLSSDFPTGVNGAGGGASASAPSSGFGANSYAPGGSNFVSQGDAGSSLSAGKGFTGTSGTPSSVKIPGAGVSGNNISGAGGGSSSFMNAVHDPSFSNIGKALSSNSGLLTSGAGLAKDLIMSGPLPGEKELKGSAENLAGQGSKLQGYLDSGTLPPGVQGNITQATQSAKAAIRSKYASMGMSGSSAEQQDLANVDAQAQTQGANIAMSLLQMGMSETGMANAIYDEMIKNSMANDQNFASSLANLGTAVAGNGKAA